MSKWFNNFTNKFKWFNSLPIMKKCVGSCDNYNRGKVNQLCLIANDCTIIWVQYKNYSKAYKWLGC